MTAYMAEAKTIEWETPPGLFARLDARYGFTLDACATPQNAKCPRFYTVEDDGLKQPWGGLSGAILLTGAAWPRGLRKHTARASKAPRW